jgi:hypothetical protein
MVSWVQGDVSNERISWPVPVALLNGYESFLPKAKLVLHCGNAVKA